MNNRRHIIVGLLAPLVLIGVCEDCVTEPTNHNPIVTSIVAFPNPVQLADSFLVTCSAHDVDGDPLTYDWECSNYGASIKGAPTANPFKLANTMEDTRVFYARDSIPSLYENYHAAIFCDVRDGKGGLKTVTITVLITR